MKECPRCGFMNPKKSIYCIKCKYVLEPEEKLKAEEELRKTPPAEGQKNLEGFGFLDAGGAQAGGISPRKRVGPPPSDAHAIMVGEEETKGHPSRKKATRRKSKTRARRGKPRRGIFRKTLDFLSKPKGT
ncbi:MAG: zinc finger Ran-binding domain-containing protein [Actinomycetota bacterium]|nr:zinc finger Ran-binding domain-containing protein [Actinomycetota bacterium]